MSVLFGVYNRGGEEVDRPAVEKMGAALSYWQPDGRGLYFGDDIALGHLMLWNTPESKLENLPLKRDPHVITVDARLDNRQELIAELGLKGSNAAAVTDSEIIVEAYKKWGNGCPAYLLGDFVFVIWDEQKRTLFCARDHMGIRQLYYHAADDRFVFASDLRGFEPFPELVKNINDDAVADYLILGELVDIKQTFFTSILKLPPAHTLTVTAESCDLACYWHPENSDRIDLPDIDAYARRLRDLLEDAVACRLRTAYPVVSHLSGGLDSSSIAVIAKRRLQEKNGRLHAVNWIHPPEGDENAEHFEWKNSRVLAERYGIELEHVDLCAEDICSLITARDIANGDTTRFWYEYPVRKAAGRLGARTILSGWGGDEFATYHGQSFFVDLFLHGKIIKLCREFHLLAAMGSGSYLKRMVRFLYHDLLLLLLPDKIYYYLAGKQKFQPADFRFFSDAFKPVVKKRHEIITARSFRPKKSIRAHMLDMLLRGHLQSRIESWGITAVQERVEYSYPLLDKRILELVLAAPPEYFFYEGRGRYLFRLAAEGLLPKKILWSDAKSEQFRVKRFLELTTASLKEILSGGEINAIHSKYLNKQEIVESIEKMTAVKLNRSDVITLSRLVSSVSLLMSGKLRISDKE